MRLRVVAVGRRMPPWVDAGWDEYARRMPPELPLEITEVPLGRRGRNADIERLRRDEGAAVLAAVSDRDHVVALDGRGSPWSTEKLAARLEHWMQSGQDVSLLVGGPDGLSAECLAAAGERWSLGPLTLPHPLVRVIVAEALYRAWTVTRGHPYHRA